MCIWVSGGGGDCKGMRIDRVVKSGSKECYFFPVYYYYRVVSSRKVLPVLEVGVVKKCACLLSGGVIAMAFVFLR